LALVPRDSKQVNATTTASVPDAQGRFGPYGGRFVPETLMYPLQQLEEEYFRAQQDPEFQQELSYYLRHFVSDAPARCIWPNG
jgi:tryptophan synthase beta chain